MGIPDCFFINQRKPHLAKPIPHSDVPLPSDNTSEGTRRLPATIGLVVCVLFLCLAWPTTAYPQEAGAILSQIGNTYRHLKSYSFTGEVQETEEVDSSKYRSAYPLELVSSGGPHVGVRYHDGTMIRKIAGNGPEKPGLLHVMPPQLAFQFFRLPDGLDSAKILGQGSVFTNGKKLPCFIVEIHWRVTVDNPEMVKGSVEKLWVGKANHLVLKASFTGFNSANPTHPHLVEHWVITFQSYKLNGPVPSWYHPYEHLPRERVPKSELAKHQRVSPPPAIGSVAPDFTLKNLQGQSESLASARGRPVLIDFWATWCAPCRGEEAILEKVEKQWSSGTLTIFRITNEEPRWVQSFLTRNREHFSTLVLGQKVWDRYGVYVLPTLVLINGAGRVVLYHKAFLSEKALIADLKKAD